MTEDIQRILIVDDEPEFVKTIYRHLRREGFALYSANDGKMAKEEIQNAFAQGLPIQLVITDVLMPRLDGIELLTWIKQTHPEISVIAVSGFADTLLAGKLIRPEMDEYCQKPFTPQEMMLLLERVQEKRRNHEFDHE